MGDQSSPSSPSERSDRRREGGHGRDRGRRDRSGPGRRRGGDDARRGGRDRERPGGRGPPRDDRGGGRRYFGPREGHERRLGGGGAPEATGERVLVLPGEELKVTGLRPGFGTYREDGRLFASVMGLLSARPPFARVIPLAGRYIPQKDDLVVGVVQAVGPTYWLLDIRAPHFTPLHVSGVPWQLDYGETVEYLKPGETVLVRVEGLDENRRVGVSMSGPNLGKLDGGFLVEISPSKVPRVIGKSGSMIQLIQGSTGARLVVGQNGRVWIDGGPEQIRKVREVLELIDEEGQRRGLTDRVKALLASQGSRDRGPDASFPDQAEEEKE